MQLVGRRLATVLAAALGVGLRDRERAALANPLPYCIPGVTAERCLGSFWEGGALYEKLRIGVAPLSSEQYAVGLEGLQEVRRTLRGLRGASGPGDEALGSAAAGARAELRRVGGRVVRALDEEAQYESKYLLDKCLAALDDVDFTSIRGRAGAAPGFSQASLLLDEALTRCDAFLQSLPSAAPAAGP